MTQYTTDDLIKSVRVRGMFPDASKGSLSAENILLMATEELRETIVPIIMSVREKYYETFIDYPMTEGQAIYQIPERAVGSLASCVQYIINKAVTNLAPLDPNQVATTDTGSYPKGFYFENDHIVIYPMPNATQGDVRIRYFQRPSILADTLDCAQITAVDPANNTVTVRTYPSSWASAMLMDFVSNKVPYSPYGVDTAIKVISAGNVISFDALPTNREGKLQVVKGDWLALAGYTPIPEIMTEFFPVLSQRVVVKILEATGDKEGSALAKDDLKFILGNAIKLITPRDQFGLKKVKSDWRNW
jgi:hypothetical protein